MRNMSEEHALVMEFEAAGKRLAALANELTSMAGNGNVDSRRLFDLMKRLGEEEQGIRDLYFRYQLSDLDSG
ncbi:MAG: hypothetical protein HKL98_02040 [Burkholderiales bacterium]|nr:hypothetical protein [Burkholderiales bacterium]